MHEQNEFTKEIETIKKNQNRNPEPEEYNVRTKKFNREPQQQT